MDNFFLQLVKERDLSAAKFLKNLDDGIQVADDIADCQAHPEEIRQVLKCWNQCFKLISEQPRLYSDVLMECSNLLSGFEEDLSFVPGKNLADTDMVLWGRRGRRAMIGYRVLCGVDQSFETEENRLWVERLGLSGLILNDCSDILFGRFEDFIKTRRNYVALSRFEPSIYFEWRQRTRDLEIEAEKIRENLVLPSPPDERFQPIYDFFLESR